MQTPVFSSSQTLPDLSVGFEYPASDRSSLFSLLSALIESDLTVLVGADGMPPISYGLQRRHTIHLEGETRAPLDSCSVSGLHFTFLGALTNPPWMGEAVGAPGLLGLTQLPFMDLDEQEVFEAAFTLHVGDRNDVAAITDRIFPEAPLVRGRIDDPKARIHVRRRGERDGLGPPVTQIRPEADGTFALRLPAGDYEARALAPGERSALARWSALGHASSVRLVRASKTTCFSETRT